MGCIKLSVMRVIHYIASKDHKEVVVDIPLENGNFSDRSLTRKEIVGN